MKSQVHMICGLTGAGKSTYAEKLRQDRNAVRFSIDEWNDTLFFKDRDPASDFDWFYERVQRSCAQMRETAQQVIQTGAPVIFDCGFTNLKERQIFYDWADDRSFTTRLHFIDVSADVRWQRVEKRNRDKGETYRIDVTRPMFDFMQGMWEAPSAEEIALRNGQRIVN